MKPALIIRIQEANDYSSCRDCLMLFTKGLTTIFVVYTPEPDCCRTEY
jgi:hypothetical protein